MGDRSQIEWTDATWNPTRGCSKVSEGCRNCYAMRQAIRQSGPGGAYEGLVHNVPGKGPQWTGKVAIVEGLFDEPLRWRKPRRIFVDSMSDLFHPDVPPRVIARLWATMDLARRHTFQILTKRPERAAEIIPTLAPYHTSRDGRSWPLPNVWLGTSVEDQAAADERIPHLLRAPAAVRFLSCEPLLGPVRIGPPALNRWCTECGKHHAGEGGIHWVIAGGESGPGARRCELAWLRDLRDQCRAAATAFFLKQVGARPLAPSEDWVGRKIRMDVEGLSERVALRLADRKGGEPEEWPEDLRVREFPNTPAGATHG